MEKRIQRWIEKYAKFFHRYKTDSITVVHHNDADGLCAGTILKIALENLGHKVSMVCIEKVHEKIVQKIHEKSNGFVIYTDLAGFVPDIIDKSCGNDKVLIIDHHPVKITKTKNVKVLDLEMLKISGDLFVSASSLCYFFARALGIDGVAHIAVIGAVGDYHDRYGGLLGLDRYAFEEAERIGTAELRIGINREEYFIQPFKEDAHEIAEKLGLLGFVGYYSKNYIDAVNALCKNRFSAKTKKLVKELKKLRDEKFMKAVKMLREGGIKKTKHVQWFHVRDLFYPMGVKTVGEFCQIIKEMKFLDDNKYLIGMQNVPRHVPDLGEIEWDIVKVSARAPAPLERKIIEGKVPGFDKLFALASKKVNATADAIHAIAAATLVDKGKEKEFIKWLDYYAETKR